DWASREKALRAFHRNMKQIMPHDMKEAMPPKQPAAEIETRITQQAKALFSHICAETESQLGPPPCAFVVLGLGSYSRGEMSFGSDWDIAFLLENAQGRKHIYFSYFIDLLIHKTSVLPAGLWRLEEKGLAELKAGKLKLWQGTSKQLLTSCFFPTDPPAAGGLPESGFPLRWPQSLYASGVWGASAQPVWEAHQQRLIEFFQQHDDTGRPYYQLTEPWALRCKLRENDVFAGPVERKTSGIQSIKLKDVF